ncbi:hypothetical protein [Ferrimonas sp. YFM]|uniref:hypothetical protein n=1 Tax=Ferrimonas sp. YFM TaxID=3028878 RepID=UPI0025732446|nr:hypothetical protein [Ferrimonas sp. YFM]BDY06344.1 hypothetical protein F0521_33850 [Ferrimonas sp. YFM]
MLSFILITSLTFSAQFHLVPAEAVPDVLEQLSAPQCNRADVQLQWQPAFTPEQSSPSQTDPAPRLVLHYL